MRLIDCSWPCNPVQPVAKTTRSECKRSLGASKSGRDVNVDPTSLPRQRSHLKNMHDSAALRRSLLDIFKFLPGQINHFISIQRSLDNEDSRLHARNQPRIPAASLSYTLPTNRNCRPRRARASNSTTQDAECTHGVPSAISLGLAEPPSLDHTIASQQ